MNCEIVCTRGPMKGRRWAITPNGLKMGRDASCEIQVKDLSSELFHCIVKLADGKPVVLNLASTKGVDVNGSYVGEALLKPNDTICIGNEKFEVAVLAAGRGGAGSKVPITPIALTLIAVAAVGAHFIMRAKSAKRPAAVERPVVPVEALVEKGKPAEAAVATNRMVRIVNEEVITTNRIVRIVDNIMVTNYIVEVRRNGEIVSSTAMPEQTEREKSAVVKEVAPAEPKQQVVKQEPQQVPAGQEPQQVQKDNQPEIVLPPYEVIDSKTALAMGGASGGDEVRMVVNTNGTRDIIHLFTETEVTKTFVVPKNNHIIPNSWEFLVVGGGGTSSTWDGRGGGGAGGVVFRKNVNVVPGTAYVYVGSGGERYGWHGRNGDDSILTLCGKTYVAIGGGAGGGFSGGSGGGGQSITGQIGKGLQTKSASGGIGHDGFGDKGEIRCGGGGAAAQSSISGDLVMYAKGGVDEVCSPSEAKGKASTGSGASFGGWDGPSFFKLAGGSGIVVLRYTVKRPVSRLPVANVPPEFPGQDRNVRTKWVSGIEWRYFVEKDGSATIGSHAEGGLEHPDLWQPAVDVNALSGIVKIPDKIDGRPVRKIGKGALQGCMGVIKFVVPDGVTHCGPRAFARCPQLEVVEYPASLQSLGDGQVYNSRKIEYLRFQSAPPQCEIGRCPYKGVKSQGVEGEGVKLCVPFGLIDEWKNRSRWDWPFYRCTDGCHLCALRRVPSDKEMGDANRQGAGFICMHLKWEPMKNLHTEKGQMWKWKWDKSTTNDVRRCQDWLVQRVADVWRNFDGRESRRVLSPAIAYNNSEDSATIFVAMMHFAPFEPVYFEYSMDDYGMIMIDDNIAVDFSTKSSFGKTLSSTAPIVYPAGGWHRIAIISANVGGAGGGWTHYKRGEKGKWQMFEANPDGSEFRVTKEDARRAIADIERAKQAKGR